MESGGKERGKVEEGSMRPVLESLGISSGSDRLASARHASAYIKQLIHHSRSDYEV